MIAHYKIKAALTNLSQDKLNEEKLLKDYEDNYNFQIKNNK